MGFYRIKKSWIRFWMNRAGLGRVGRAANYLAGIFTPPYYGRVFLSRIGSNGYISPRATIHHSALELDTHTYIDDGVLIYQDNKGGPVVLGQGVHIHRDTTIQTGRDGSITIGSETHVQPRCQFSAYEGPIHIGERVEIAPNCAFYSYDHQILPGMPVREQPLRTKGGVSIGDDAWLGYGVIVLDGVRIGEGAVIGAGAVVSSDIPDYGVAVGVPARVVKLRTEIAE